MSHYSDCHQLLSVVSAVHHEGVGQSLDDWALCFSESLRSISASGVGDVDGLSDLDIITANSGLVPIRISSALLYVRERDISDFDILVAPFVEQFDTAYL